MTIWSQGVRLQGDLYKPKNLTAEQQLPGILLVPGWGGVKKNLEKNYAPHFAEKGFIVLTLDFKGWGESDGPIVATEALEKTEEAADITLKATHFRKMVNPLSMSEDVRAAIHYLGSEPQVMPNNLGIWGTSMGGGLALVTAATDDRIKAYVNQMGPVNYTYNLQAIPDQRVRGAEAMVARGQLPSYPGPQGQNNPLLRGYPDWIAMKRFDPMAYLDRLTAPTLIIEAEQEELYNRQKNGVLMHQIIKDRIESRYIAYPGKHYAMYSGDNLEAGREAALQWFLKYLKGQ
ncbi:dienelactone hydrolase [Oceanicoccus sagamiensis]|uniref:Dienelactone hydrolase n=1 Tax=Oceanicoccus sagamiensis TaxID=716816 RepID=A0A1X9NKT6_9GAMM|nr:dienelactone hydrolase [Oceanicoccus sagamiensis]